jgi:platelet-activating factor acetylhydrolase
VVPWEGLCWLVCNPPFSVIANDVCRCGVALDPWMYPVNEELYSRTLQPLLFINSAKFQTPKDIAKMKKFYQPDKERKMITIK